MVKVNERRSNEIKLIKKVLRQKLTPCDLHIIINSPLALELLGSQPGYKIKGVDNRKIEVIREFVD